METMCAMILHTAVHASEENERRTDVATENTNLNDIFKFDISDLSHYNKSKLSMLQEESRTGSSHCEKT